LEQFILLAFRSLSGNAPLEFDTRYNTQTESKPAPAVACPRCGSAMKLVKVIYKDCLLLVKCSTHQQQRFDDSG
jgi:hypothetical protein